MPIKQNYKIPCHFPLKITNKNRKLTIIKRPAKKQKTKISFLTSSSYFILSSHILLLAVTILWGQYGLNVLLEAGVLANAAFKNFEFPMLGLSCRGPFPLSQGLKDPLPELSLLSESFIYFLQILKQFFFLPHFFLIPQNKFFEVTLIMISLSQLIKNQKGGIHIHSFNPISLACLMRIYAYAWDRKRSQ